MKFTKILALLVALILCLSMVSCSGIFTKLFGDEGETESESLSTEETESVVTEGVDTSDELDESEGSDDILGDLGDEEEGNKLPDGQVIYFEDFQSYGNTSDNSALDTLGWKKMTVKDDKVMAEADVEFDFENGRLHVNTWNAGEELVPGHAFYAITQLNDEVMSTLAAGGYTLQYDIEYTQDIAKASVLSSLIINFSENNWTDMAVRPNGIGLFENVTGGKAFLLGDSGIAATGNTVESSISGVLLNEAPGKHVPLLNLSVTVRVQVDPKKGPIFYVKNSADPDSEFVKVGETVISNGFVGWMAAKSKAVALHTCGGLNVYYDNILVYSGLGECPVTIVPDGFNG